ncbi:hypothetical protein [Kitasatospora sp. NPDC088548]|uniref:hypothetical protein n=1 Tax=Kitasatospora sp. NPDC088548 TaxID=3364075 RepID=UPI0037FDE816
MRNHMRNHRYGAAAVLLAGMALFTAACGGGVAGSGGGGGSDSSGKGAAADQAYEHRKCLREHGAQVKEPEPGQDPRGLVLEGGQDKMAEALKACGGVGGSGGAKMSQADKDKVLEFAQCMRSNGVDMPDPKFDGDSAISGQAMKIPEGAEKDRFDKANKACSGQHAE